MIVRLRRHLKARVIHSLPHQSRMPRMGNQKMLKPSKPILTLKKVLEVEKHGLSINKSAYLLGVSMPKLWRFIKKNNIQWSGKNPCFRKNEVNPDSTLQRIKRSGICKGTIYYRINVMGLTLEQALAIGSSK